MLILTDIDGVWLNWIGGFVEWVEQTKGILPVVKENTRYELWDGHYYTQDRATVESWIYEYNASEESDNVKEMEGSENLLFALAKDYDIIAITSNDVRRMEFLNSRFPNVFKEIYITELLCHKTKVLKRFQPSVWIEDNYKNAMSGINCWHETALISRPYNVQFTENVKPLSQWQKGTKTICRVENYDELMTFIQRNNDK